MKRLFILVAILLALGLTIVAQNTNKVAILEIVDKNDNVDYGVKLQLRAFLTYAINRTPGYEGYDRVDMSSILSEHNFQRTGFVSDIQIKKLGEMTGANSILVAEAARYGADANRIIITAKILNVETALVQNSSRPKTASTDDVAMEKACVELAAELLGSGGSFTTMTSGNRSVAQNADVITITVGGVSFDMIKVEAGSFIMGCTSEQGNDCWEYEVPFHRVTITQDYYIGKYEVTQELWQAVMGTNPSYFKAYGLPVENVSWNDVQEFCSELSRMTGRRFRLPTEAEWEYAARGGKKSTNAKYSGSSSAADVAWTVDNSGHKTHSVGKLRPNELGLYDMSGNVGEYCQDWFGDYSSASQTDPKGPTSCSVGSYHIFRGGSFIERAESCRVCWRFFHKSDDRFLSEGLRLVLEQ